MGLPDALRLQPVLMIAGRVQCGLALISLTGCAATQPEPTIEAAVNVAPSSFPAPPPSVAPSAIPTPDEATAIFRTVFDWTAERSDRADALEGSAEENAAVFDSGGIMSEASFDRIDVVAPGRVEASGTSVGRVSSIGFVVSEGRWKLERSTACAVTGVC
ncbi:MULTISPECIES: hypothetical protein [unclassified Rhodococcus (in: high G+C Gram-positive bacteria)]|uniref:hypothetical protein n=1 Tax=unclassified Rhodococcus (in: high G+C Gram-positive bacteria) TaxID=192944 RepID=UPI0011403A65|nr:MULTISPECIES: hypothetical protein [unclassified Rhodococcus (in: high G+C Gram-positive bacteria)]